MGRHRSQLRRFALVFGATCQTLGVVIALAVATRAGGQAAGASLNELALDWSRGRYASPIVCSLDGQPTRALRRVLIAPGPRHVHPPVGRIVFVDLDPGDATRCFDDLGAPQPNVQGNLQIRLSAPARRELAHRDFEAALRRKRGFEFEILEGRLQLQTVTAAPGPSSSRNVDFAGGSAKLHLIERSSDEARLLSDLPGLRNVALEIESKDGTRLRFPLALTAPR